VKVGDCCPSNAGGCGWLYALMVTNCYISAFAGHALLDIVLESYSIIFLSRLTGVPPASLICLLVAYGILVFLALFHLRSAELF
jgi:hypothetical protein